jgi:hypothetical protein
VPIPRWLADFLGSYLNELLYIKVTSHSMKSLAKRYLGIEYGDKECIKRSKDLLFVKNKKDSILLQQPLFCVKRNNT